MDLLRRRAAQELERPPLDRRRQAPDDLLGARVAERALEHAARVLDTALGDERVGEHGLDRFGDHGLAGLGRHLARLRDLQRQRLDLGLAEMAEDLARVLLAHRDEQHRGLLDPPHVSQSSAIHCLTWAATRSGSRVINWLSVSMFASGARGGSIAPVRCSSSASVTGSSISVSHAGSASVSPSRLRRWRPMKNRNSSEASPIATHLIGPSSEVGTGPAFGTSGLANGTWAACIVSPRSSSTPAALATASWTEPNTSAGTDLSTSTATFRRLTAPGATSVRSTRLPTPISTSSVSRW